MHLLVISYKKWSVHCHLSFKNTMNILVIMYSTITYLCTNCYRKLFDWMSWISG